jgi:hypothetical protein
MGVSAWGKAYQGSVFNPRRCPSFIVIRSYAETPYADPPTRFP